MKSGIFTFLVCIFTLGLALGQKSTTGCTLIKYDFDGNIVDQSGHNVNLKNHGDVTYTTDRNGKKDKAVHFDGSNYLWAKVDTLLSKEAFSVAFWAKPESFNTGNARIFSVGPPNTFWHYYCNVLVENTGKIGFIGHTLSGAYSFYDYSSVACTGDEWVHSVSVYRNDSTFIYQNGDLVAKSAHKTKVVTYKDSMQIQLGAAYHPSNVMASYVGDLDDLQMFCKALTPDEVKNLYNPQSNSVKSINSGGLNVNIMPNPSNGAFVLQHQLMPGLTLNAELISSTGQLVQTLPNINGEGEFTVNTVDLPSGVYHLKMIDAKTGYTFNRKVVLN